MKKFKALLSILSVYVSFTSIYAQKNHFESNLINELGFVYMNHCYCESDITIGNREQEGILRYDSLYSKYWLKDNIIQSNDSLFDKTKEFFSLPANNWSGEGKEFFNLLVSVKNNSSTASFYEKYYSVISENYKNSCLLESIALKLNEYDEFISNPEAKNQNAESYLVKSDKNTKKTENLDSVEMAETAHFNVWKVLFYVSVLVLIILIVYHFFLISRLKAKNGKLKNKSEESRNKLVQIEKSNQNLGKQNKDLKERVSSLENKNDELEEIISKLNTELESKKDVRSLKGTSKSSEMDSDNTLEQESLEKDKILYLSFPDDEKRFYLPEATESPTSKTFYVLRNERILELYDKVSSDTMLDAMHVVEIRVERVCDLVNVKEDSSQKIIMQSPGKAEKDGEFLRVTEKIQVKYD